MFTIDVLNTFLFALAALALLAQLPSLQTELKPVPVRKRVPNRHVSNRGRHICR
ncbi:MAG: hypothetical protein JKY27_01715 [Magnetovibrio sp.]|nr:hypothetical protein [Magnetovibrio sp.]